MSKKMKIALVLNIVIIVLEIIGTSISYSNNGFSNLFYYTVDSNLLAFCAGVMFVITALMKKSSKAVYVMRFIATVNLSLTFTVVMLVLAPMAMPAGNAGKVIYKGAQLYHHLLCPIISFISFVFLEEGGKPGKKLKRLAIIPTILYAVVLIILNAVGAVVGPYPFLMVRNQPIWASILWFVLIVGMGYAFVHLIAKIKRE